MKKKLLALAPLCLYGAAAWAQSNLTLYGVLDEGIMFNSNVATGPSKGGQKWYLDSLNGMYGSRWGMKGAEDLGGGTRAIFTLESGVNLNSGAAGQGGLQFGRQAAVGLSNRRFGDLTLGRQYDSVVNYAQAVTSQGYLASEVFQHPGDFDNTANSLRTNNAIRYASPNINGLTFGATWSVGGQPGNISGNGGYSAGAAYSNGVVTPRRLPLLQESDRGHRGPGLLHEQRQRNAVDRHPEQGLCKREFVSGRGSGRAVHDWAGADRRVVVEHRVRQYRGTGRCECAFQ
jgi:predicted porin